MTPRTEGLTRNEELILFFARRCSGFAGRTKLVKLIYMADHEAYRFLGEPISEFRWTRRDYGPFDPAFYDAQESLEARELLAIEIHGDWHRFQGAGPTPDFSFTPAESVVLEHIVKEYVPMKTEDLMTNVVYKTRPFVAVENEKFATIPMDMVSGEMGGLDIESIQAARQRIRAGQGVPLADALSAIRGNR